MLESKFSCAMDQLYFLFGQLINDKLWVKVSCCFYVPNSGKVEVAYCFGLVRPSFHACFRPLKI